MRIWSLDEVANNMEWLLHDIELASLDSPAAERPTTLLAWLLAGAAEFWELDRGWAITAINMELDGPRLLFVLVSHEPGKGMTSGLLDELSVMEEEARKRGCVRAAFISNRKEWERVGPEKFGYQPRAIEYAKEL